MKISLRAITIEDEQFLFAVYTSTRADELARVDWNAAQKEAFLQMQFRMQTNYYNEHFSDAIFQIVLLDEQPIGRLYVHRKVDEIRVIDIALLPEVRGRGIGSELLNQILDEAQTSNLPVSIHVERMNPAMRLYERLGFCFLAEHGIYHLMEWTPKAAEVRAHAG